MEKSKDAGSTCRRQCAAIPHHCRRTSRPRAANLQLASPMPNTRVRGFDAVRLPHAWCSRRMLLVELILAPKDPVGRSKPSKVSSNDRQKRQASPAREGRQTTPPKAELRTNTALHARYTHDDRSTGRHRRRDEPE